MKTKFLKWDVNVQFFMALVNTPLLVLCCFFHEFVFFIFLMQLLEGFYQFASSGINLLLNHKSLGFIHMRRLHFFGSIAYLAVLFGTIKMNEDNMPFTLVMLLVVPQFIFYSYFFLCRKELHFLETREFHILR